MATPCRMWPKRGKDLKTIGHGGSITHYTDGVFAKMTTPREVHTEISCIELSASLRAITDQCAQGIGFGGRADNLGIWAMEIGTDSPPTPQKAKARDTLPMATTIVKVEKSVIDASPAAVTPTPASQANLAKRDITTVVEIIPGITQTFEFSEPLGVPSIDVPTDPLIANVGHAFNDLQ